jgi:hypothetical protein
VDDFERVSDGFALQGIRKDAGFMALERLLVRMRGDLFRKWSEDEGLSRDYCKGAMEVLDVLLPNVDEMIGYAIEERKKDAEVRAATRGTALDGHGTGDLAL